MADTSKQTNISFPWLDLLPVVVLSGAGLLSNTLANQYPLPSTAPAVPIFLGSLVAVVLLEWLRILLRPARRRWQRRLRGIVQTLLIPVGAVAGLLSNYAANALQARSGLSAS